MKTVSVYSLEELKSLYPAGYQAAFERFSESVYSSGEIPRSDEVMDSLTAVLSAFGLRMADWSIGPDSGELTVRGDDDFQELSGGRALVRVRSVLRGLGYCDGKRPEFTGLCKLTGYCADDDFLESLWRDLSKGSTVREAFEGLASVASRHMADDLEQAASEESFQCNADHLSFLADGRTV